MTAGLPDLSVVIPVYLGEKWISMTLDSVLNQSHANLEAIVVNDASPDGCAALLEQYQQRDPRVRILTHPVNRGIAVSYNDGLREARGRYVCILDQDDLWKPDKTARQIAYLEQHPAVDAVYCRVDLIDSQGRWIRERILPDPKEGDLFIPIFTNGMPPPLVACMFRGSLLQRVGLFNETLKGNEDLDLALRISKATPWGFVPEVLVALRHMRGTFSDTDAMVFDQFRLADLLEATWPEYPQLLKRFRSTIHYRTGHYLVRTDRLGQSRSHFLKAALQRPSFLKAWGLWTVAWVPRPLQRFLPVRLRLSPEKYRFPTAPSEAATP